MSENLLYPRFAGKMHANAVSFDRLCKAKNEGAFDQGACRFIFAAPKGNICLVESSGGKICQWIMLSRSNG